MYRNILVPVDPSPHSKRALDAALSMAKEAGANVTVLYVNDVGVSFGGWMLAAGPMIWPPRQVVDGEKVLAGILSDVASPQSEGPELKIKSRLATGFPVEMILHVAKDEQADLLVMGTRGLGRITGPFLGSVSQGVVQNAPCPVLLVR